MRWRKTRLGDSSFDLNLAPFLDIIVSVVPMLLLTVAFHQVKMIETPVPQVVEKAIEELNKKPTTDISLKISKKAGFVFTITTGARRTSEVVPMKGDQMDWETLYTKAIEIKRRNPDVFSLTLEPDSDIELRDIVSTLDQVRKLKKTETQLVQIKDPATGQPLTTDLMFPKVSFGNVVGG